MRPLVIITWDILNNHKLDEFAKWLLNETLCLLQSIQHDQVKITYGKSLAQQIMYNKEIST